MKPIILPYNNILPQIDKTAYVAPGSAIIGDVKIGKNSTIWFNCTVRGDVEPIVIGDYTNVQDGTVIHVTRGGGKTFIGSYVTIGHRAIIHAATLQDYSFVGMGATIMDDVVVESGAMVAAGSLVTNGKIIKSGEIWAGSPAKFFRKLTEEETKYIEISAKNYARHADEYNAL